MDTEKCWTDVSVAAREWGLRLGALLNAEWLLSLPGFGGNADLFPEKAEGGAD